MFDPITALAAFAPLVVNAGNALVNRYLVPDTVKPASVAEVVQLRELDLKQFEILQNADTSGATYQWVEAIRKLQRPFVVVGLFFAFVLHPDNEVISSLFEVVGFYLFGERTLLRRVKK